jgi:hypothetical protein
MYTAVAFVFGAWADYDHIGRWAEQLQYIPYFFLQTFAQLTLAFLMGFLIKKAFIALGIFFFYTMVLENIAVTYAKFKLNDIGKYLPFEISDRIITLPAFMTRMGKDLKDAYEKSLAEVNTHIVLTILLTTAVWTLCYYIHKKRDL